MPPRRWIDKKNAATYQLFHRPQDDPLINDPEAQDRILHQVRGPQPTPEQASAQHKTGKTLEQLQREFANERVRKNEGEAANFGIYYDDTEYDYMQHLKELGGDGTGHYVEARTAKEKPKSMKLEDMLAQTSLDDSRSDMLSTASTYSRKPTYQDMQNIPDAIAGFQPDMDPRLREALEALENDAFVEEDGEGDLFDQLVADGEEVDPDEFRDTYIEDDDEGWESDATEKAPVQPRTSEAATKEKEPFRIDNDGGAAPTEMPREDEVAVGVRGG
ncbi:hypothetical protein KEM55_000318 [Ascosphaera atra]|nr:hypothetical protein KEM55_000318 [Ascosphaera atra]